MAVIDAANDFRKLQDCWFPQFLEFALRQQLTPQEGYLAEAWINAHVFDAACADPKGRMNVTDALRRAIPNHPDFVGTPLMPLYDKTGQDQEHTARLYGNLVCRVGIKRPEVWWCFPEPVADDRFSRTYILQSRIASVL